MEDSRTQLRSLVEQGQRALRRGHVGDALSYWQRAMDLDPDAAGPRAFHDYVKRNRIRLSVYLGKHSVADSEPLALPEEWPAPPAGLCDPIAEAPSVAPDDASGARRSSMSTLAGVGEGAGGDALGVSGVPRGATPDRSGADSGEYAVLEIIVDEEDEPAGSAKAPGERREDELPPPPISLDAPELDLAPPPEGLPAEAEPEDYVVGKTDSARLEAISLERFAGGADPPDPHAVSGAVAEGAPPETEQGEPPDPDEADGDDFPADGRPPTFAEDAPTIARESRASPPAVVPAPPPASETQAPGADAPRGGAAPPSAVPAGATPSSTLVGLGPEVLAQLEARGAPPGGSGSAAQGPIAAEEGDGDFSGGEGSFSDDLPTRARTHQTPASGSHRFIRPMPHAEPEDFSGGEGSFSDDLPTRARGAAVPASAPLLPPSSAVLPRARVHRTRERSEAPPGGADFSTGEGSFSDLPTRARGEAPGSRPAVRPMPLGAGFSGKEPSLPEGLLSEEGLPEDLNDEIEGLLDPDRGLAAARRLAQAGQHERSLQIVERLLERYRATPEMEALLDTNQRALEPSLLAQVGPPETVLRPRLPDGGLSGLDLDPRAAFLLSRIDSPMRIEDILDVSGMSRFETARLLLRLRQLGLLEGEGR